MCTETLGELAYITMNTSNDSTPLMVPCSIKQGYYGQQSDYYEQVINIYFTSSSVTNVLTNLTVIAALVKTKQIVNATLKILISIRDLLTGGVAQPATIIGMNHASVDKCSAHIASQFLNGVLLRISAHFVSYQLHMET